MQTTLGAQKIWANRIGISLEEYLDKISQGLKRCMKCKNWKSITEYPKDKSRKDGLHTRCFPCQRINRPPQWHTLTDKEKENLRQRNINNPPMKGKHLSLKHRQRLRQCRIEEGKNGIGSFYGENNPNWKGGVSNKNQILRHNSDYKQWRQKVFERDDYKCQKCGDNKGSNLEPHHIKSWAEYPELRYDINNGITLCCNCHGEIHDKPDSYRKRRKQKQSFCLF